MPCTSPILGWRGKGGKVFFKPKEALSPGMVRVPCGQCMHCRKVRALGWAVRIMCEAALHQENSFITLTYRDPMPPGGLCDRDFQLFMKRFRKALEPTKIRFFAVGEYGDQHHRKHWHACIFGWYPCPHDQYEVSHGHVKSHTLDAAWGLGLCDVGFVEPKSAAYVGQYAMKKMTGSFADEWYLDEETGEICQREHSLQSRGGRNGHGIGYDWFVKHRDNMYPSDSIYFNGSTTIPPSYYMQLLKAVDPSMAEEVANARVKKFDEAEYDRLVLDGVQEKYNRSKAEVLGGTRHREI